MNLIPVVILTILDSVKPSEKVTVNTLAASLRTHPKGLSRYLGELTAKRYANVEFHPPREWTYTITSEGRKKLKELRPLIDILVDNKNVWQS